MKIKLFKSLLFILVNLVLFAILDPQQLVDGRNGKLIYYLPVIRYDRSPSRFDGMDGGTVECIAIDPKNSEVIYAGTWGNGIYKSENGGLNWSKMNQNLKSAYIYDIAIDPQNSQHILASVYKQGVNQSFDDGKNWQMTKGIPTGAVIYTIDFHPRNPSIVFIGLREPTITYPDGTKDYPGGVFKSFDGGSTWVRMSSGLSYDYVYDLGIDPNNPNVIYTAMHDTGVYKSKDGGENWVAMNSTLPLDDIDIRSVDINPVNSDVYIAHWDGDGFSYSKDGGHKWVRVASTDASNMFVYEVLVDHNHPSTVYLVTAAGVYSCENPTAKSTCSLLNYGGKFVFDLALDSNGPLNNLGMTRKMYAGLQNFGIFKSLDVGVSFEPKNNGIQANIINSLFIDPVNPSIQYVSSLGRGLYKSEDNGISWYPINNGLTDRFVNLITSNPENPGLLYAGTQNNGIFISNNGGLNWTQSNTGLSASKNKKSVQKDFDIVTEQVYDWMDPIDRESLEVINPDQKSIPSPSYLDITTFSFDPGNSKRMIAGTNGAGVKISENAGSTWMNSSLTTEYVFDSMIDPTGEDNSYYLGLADSSVKVATTSQLNWINKNSGFHPSADVFSLAKASNSTYYAGTESGIYKTSDGGSSWERIGLKDIKIADVLIDIANKNIIWAGTDQGLYRSEDRGENWAYFPIPWLLNKDILTLTQIPGSSSFYIGTNGGNFYYFSP
ncbi:MAG: hypothetical protein RQ728_09930 [Brevefilum sp.]|nr:hypothetical protein [Brevefilum sp.]MDT8382555.1 hypothetical protein [Brevefilum sp.]MDW7755164.1 hypothetical protein [Brevefilum sp.]